MAGYRLLEKAYKGKIKSIGISNFHDEKLEHLLAECEIKPHVIQLKEHPYFSDKKTLDMLRPYGVRLMAWYPLGHGDKINNAFIADFLVPVPQKKKEMQCFQNFYFSQYLRA